MADFDDRIAALRQRRHDVLDEITLVRTGKHPIYTTHQSGEKRRQELENILLATDVEIEAYKSHNEPEPD